MLIGPKIRNNAKFKKKKRSLYKSERKYLGRKREAHRQIPLGTKQ